MTLPRPETTDLDAWAALLIVALEEQITLFEQRIQELEAQITTNTTAIADHEDRIAVLEI